MKNIRIGYALSSEEHSAPDLVRHAALAEKTGFSFLMVSDHYHPWIDRQGNSPFVWSVLGGISQVVKSVPVSTAVTCPTIRIHPAIIAQAAATMGSLMEGRFMLGLGTGENLNEHILGDGWPPVEIRQEMLAEAIEVIRLLWKGGFHSFWGEYFTVEKARIYSLPRKVPPILVAASGTGSAALAGELADGLISVSPDQKIISVFNETGGKKKPKYGQVAVCYAKSKEEAVRTAYEWWPNTALKGQLSQELRIPQYVEDAVSLIRPEDVEKTIVCGPDPKQHLEAINTYVKAGFDHIYIHQIGPDQEGFMKFYQKEILSSFSS